jgi:hypothetical protein
MITGSNFPAHPPNHPPIEIGSRRFSLPCPLKPTPKRVHTGIKPASAVHNSQLLASKED